jgi:hypothetical protein
LGRDLAIGDADGDGVDDLAISVPAGELASGPNNTGVISLYSGGSATQPTSPTQEWALTEGYEYLGIALGYVGQMDDDGLGDFLVHSDRALTYGPQAGAPFVLSMAEVEPVLLDFDIKSAGHAFGQHGTMTFIDANGDGIDDLVFSGHGAGNSKLQANAGMLYALTGNATGFDFSNLYPLSLYDKEWGANSRKGYRLMNIGDFTQDGADDFLTLSRDESKGSSLDSSVYANPTECSGSVSGAGLAMIYPGASFGLGQDASFAAWGPYAYDDLRAALGRIDVNGDGQNDVVIGSHLWRSQQGGLTVLTGRAPSQTKTEILCDSPDIFGATNSDDFAHAMVSLGRLDDDACEDFAVSAPADSTHGGGGSVSIVWGFSETCTGSDCCPTEPMVTTLKTTLVGTVFGQSLAAIDIDGDGLRELLVGVPNAAGGGLVVVQGVDLSPLGRTALAFGVIPSLDTGQVISVQSLPGTLRISDQSGSGQSLAVAPHPDGDGALLAIGRPNGDGGAIVLSLTASQPSGEVIAVVGGESHKSGGLLGQGLLLRTVGNTITLVVGAPEHDAPNGLDQGGLYPFVFEMP